MRGSVRRTGRGGGVRRRDGSVLLSLHVKSTAVS